MALLDFQSYCVEDEKVKDTETSTLIEKRIPISVLTSSHLKEEANFSCDLNLRHLISSFIDSLENFATQRKTQMKVYFQNEMQWEAD